MTHTLHEQHSDFSSINALELILENELGFTPSSAYFYIGEKGHDPCICISGGVTSIRYYDKSLATSQSIAAASNSTLYWHNSSDLSVRYFYDPSSTSKTPAIWAQDINGGWSVICGNSMFVPDKKFAINNVYTQTNTYSINANNIYTISKIARSDNGAPFKGLYAVLSAQAFFTFDTLINIGGDIYRLVTNYTGGDKVYPALAFKVSDE